MRFVEIKSSEQQGVLVLRRVRLMLMRQRIALSNAIRGHMAEGLVAPVGRSGLQRLMATIADHGDDRLPAMVRASLIVLGSQLQLVNGHVLENDRRVRATARSTELGRRLMEVPGVGPLLVSAMVASVRWQGEAGRDHQAGRPLSAAAAGGRRALRHPLCSAA